MALFGYLQATQRFLREANQEFINAQDLIEYINRARREVAMRSQCIRRLTPISNQITGWLVTNGGTGYSAAPTLTITAPDFPSGQAPYPNGAQATASAQVQNGVIQAIDSDFGGYGYFQPQMTITDSTGTGATATPVMSFINQLNQGEEVYKFSDVDLSAFPGVESIYRIQSVSILFSAFRYSLAVYSFSEYQAKIRQWSQQWQYVPAVCSQYGQGVGGSFFFYPIPSQSYQMEWDCFCLPSDLVDDNSYEAIPQPWTEAVPYFAAHLGYLEIQNLNFANGYLTLFDKMIQRYSDYARVGGAVNRYGRY